LFLSDIFINREVTNGNVKSANLQKIPPGGRIQIQIGTTTVVRIKRNGTTHVRRGKDVNIDLQVC
jgi:hypothetical protein